MVGSDDAAHFIVNQTMASEPGTIRVVTLGPVTNLAQALILEPKVVICNDLLFMFLKSM